MISKSGTFKGLGIVRDEKGLVSISGELSRFSAQELGVLIGEVAKNGFVTSESHPCIDKRFDVWRLLMKRP